MGGAHEGTPLSPSLAAALPLALSLVLLLPRVGEALPAEFSTKSLLRREVVDPIYLFFLPAGP